MSFGSPVPQLKFPSPPLVTKTLEQREDNGDFLDMSLKRDFKVVFYKGMRVETETVASYDYSPDLPIAGSSISPRSIDNRRLEKDLSTRDVLEINKGAKKRKNNTHHFSKISSLCTKLHWLRSNYAHFVPESLNLFLNSNISLPIIQLRHFDAKEHYYYMGKIASVKTIEIEKSNMGRSGFLALMKAIGPHLVRLKLKNMKQILFDDLMKGLAYCPKLEILDIDIMSTTASIKKILENVPHVVFLRLGKEFALTKTYNSSFSSAEEEFSDLIKKIDIVRIEGSNQTVEYRNGVLSKKMGT